MSWPRYARLVMAVGARSYRSLLGCANDQLPSLFCIYETEPAALSISYALIRTSPMVLRTANAAPRPRTAGLPRPQGCVKR
jgi:hypothetical protein